MSQYTRIIEDEINYHKVVWGYDEFSGIYIVVFDRSNELVVSCDQKHDKLTPDEALSTLVFYGVSPVDAAHTLSLRRL